MPRLEFEQFTEDISVMLCSQEHEDLGYLHDSVLLAVHAYYIFYHMILGKDIEDISLFTPVY